MQFAPAPFPPGAAREYQRAGYHTGMGLPQLMRRTVAEFGPLCAVADGGRTLTWEELLGHAFCLAGFLEAQGIGAGDVVVWQMPNWWEALVVAYGVWAAGAVSAPVVPIYREHELANVLQAVEPRCVLAPLRFRGHDHVAAMEAAIDLWGGNPLRVVVRGSAAGWTGFDDVLAGAPFSATLVDPDAPALVGFTSGTTSGAKAVVMSTRGLLVVPLRHARTVPYTWHDRGYMAASVSHATGLLMAVTIPLVSGCSVVLADRWDPARAVEEIQQHSVTYTGGAAVFMQELADAVVAASLPSLPLSTGFSAGGSPIPTELARRCEELGMKPRRAYGMTECPTVSASLPGDPTWVRLATDGRVLPGCEVKVVAPGRPGGVLGPGQVGEFLVRGPQRALGYVDPVHTAEAFDDAGWLRTGDLGTVDASGCLTVSGRTKDVINRGGEKLSAREIEELIAGHPEVVEAAVVALPHPRLGEEPAAFVIARGAAPSEEELAGFLRARGLAPQKIPRVWITLADLPRTPSGKVKKYELVERLRASRTPQPPAAPATDLDVGSG
ncbi:MAG TPA: AMP-binding protein [Acidimicrobiales bacterium]|nr:AMP-binding protein [Acidimicrobiales bacterium]